MTKARTLVFAIALAVVVPTAWLDSAAGERSGTDERDRRGRPDGPPTSGPGRGVGKPRPHRQREPKPTLWQLQEPMRAPTIEFDPEAPVVDVAREAALLAPQVADLDPTIDVQITQEIIDKAAELGTVEAMYAFVRNECAFQPYYGSRKGSVETLRQRSGNDYDLASLLIALLRASGVPARYAEGAVEMPVDRATGWLGVDDGQVAGSILFTGGMEGVSVIGAGGGASCCVSHGTPGCDDGGTQACVCALDPFCCNTAWDQTCVDEVTSFGCGTCTPNVVAVRAHRIWVEAFTPRGLSGATWVPLDPAFKLNQVHAGLDIPEEMGLDAQQFVEEYFDPAAPGVTLPRPESVIELYVQDVAAYVATNHPGLTLDDVLRTQAAVPEDLGLLPAALPYVVRARDGAFPEIPAARRYRIRFHLHDGPSNLIDYTLDLPAIAGRRLSIDYVGATPADQAIIDGNGGIYQTPPSQVDLKPVLRVDGQDVATGAAGVGMGLLHESDVHFLAPVNGTGLPQNVVPAIFNTITTGAAQVVALSIDGVAEGLANPSPADDTEGLSSLRFDTAMDYLAAVRNAELSLGRLMHAYITTDVANAIVENVVKVTFDGFGVPQTFDWVGLRVDADRSVLGVWPVDRFDPPGGEPKQFLIVAGAQGSLDESRIYEDSFGQDSVSTIKILELASDAGITVYKRWSTLPLPANTQPLAVRQSLEQAISSGHVVTFPAAPMTIGTVGNGQWTGTGWIDMDPANGAAGYIISGNNNGGATVESWPPEFIDLCQDDRDIVQVQITIVAPAGDSPAAGAVFTRDNEQSLTFEYTVQVTYDDSSTRTLPGGGGTYKRVTRNTTKTFAPGNYTFKVWISRRVWWFFQTTIAEAERQVTIAGVLIRKDDGTAAGQDPPKALEAKCDHPSRTPSTKVKAVVVPATAPNGAALATSFAWTGGAKLTFVTPGQQATDLRPAVAQPSAAVDDQAVDVVVGLLGGVQSNGYAKFNFARGGSDEKHTMSVFHFTPSSMGVAAGGNYALAGASYTAVPPPAASFTAQGALAPAGLSCALPEITNKRIALVQNVSSTRTITWNTPAIAWAPGVPAGTTTAPLPATLRFTLTLPGTLNDTISAADAPLYERGATALRPPGGCPGSAAATSNDTPTMGAPATFQISGRTGAGVVVGVVTYNLVNVTMNDSFHIWSSSFDTATSDVCALRERTWAVSVDSAAGGAQSATVSGADTAPTMTPVLTPPSANTAGGNPANQAIGPVGAGTVTFTRP